MHVVARHFRKSTSRGLKRSIEVCILIKTLPMSRKYNPAKVDFEMVRNIGLRLPGVEEGTAYGLPALKVNGKLLACVPANLSAEPDSLVIRMDLDDRAELLAGAPDVYYLTDHYVDYDAVLVRLARVNPDVLRDLLGMAYKFVTGGMVNRSPRQKRQKLPPAGRP